MKTLLEKVAAKENSQTMWALWELNGTITADLLEKQIELLLQQGFEGVVLRPASDVFPSYTSDEYLQLFSYAIELIEQARMKFVISDNFSHPAPSLFTSTISQNSSYRAMRLVLEEDKDLEEGEVYTTTPTVHTPYYLVAVERFQHGISLEGAITISEGNPLSKNEIQWTAPAGFWKVLKLVVQYEENRDGSYMANMYSMKAAQSYITNTLEPLVQAMSTQSAKAFQGVLCELPAIVPSRAGIPWDEELLVSKYRSRFKRNLIETIPALFFEVDDNEAKYRPHVYNFLQDTLYERFPQVIQKWATSQKCEAWILGPDLDRQSPDSSLSPCLSMMPSDFLITGTTGRDVDTLSEMAFAMHAAHSQGVKNHCTLAIAGRDTSMRSFTIANLKEQLDHLIILGAQRVIIDGFKANFRYRHEETTPIGVSFHHPDFTALKTIVKSTKDTLLALGKPANHQQSIAIIAPSQSLLADYTPSNSSVVSDFNENLVGLLESLQSKLIPYTILSEVAFAECTINADGTITNPNTSSTYFGVVLLHARLINNSFFVFLEKMAIKKGLIIFLNGEPKGSFDDGQSKSFTERIAKMVNTKTKQVFAVHTDEATDLALKVLPQERVVINESSQLPGFYSRKSCYSNAYFCINRSTQDLEIPTNGENFIYEISPEGSLKSISTLDGKEVLKATLPAHSSTLLYYSSEEQKSNQESSLSGTQQSYRIKLNSDKWTFTPQSLNTIPITRWNCRMGMNKSRGNIINYYESHLESELEIAEGYLVFIDTTPSSPEHLKRHFKVSLNGTVAHPLTRREVEENELSSFFDNDETILIYHLHDSIKKGDNRLLILSTGNSNLPNPLAFPPLIALNSPVEQTPRGWKILKEGSSDFQAWNKKGYAYMVGEGKYQHYFEVPPTYQKIILNLSAVSGTTEITLNGTVLPPIYSPPYRIDITDTVTAERNNLEVIIKNSLSPITRLEPTGSGIVGEVSLEVFEKPEEE